MSCIAYQLATGEQREGWGYRFFWVDMNTWPDLSQYWGVSATNLPAIVVFDPISFVHYYPDPLGAGLRPHYEHDWPTNRKTDSRGIDVEHVVAFLDGIVKGTVQGHGGRDIGTRIRLFLTK